MESLKGRVLILDDEPAIGRCIALLAKHLEVDSISVSRPNDFFGEVERWKPTHIIVDLVMPDVDGVEVLQQLAQRGCDSRIAISSGLGSRVLNAARQSATEHGLDMAGVLPKPLTVSALRDFLFGSKDLLDSAIRNRPPKAPITHDDLLSAIEYHEFRLAFQPKIDCKTRVLVGFETLVRWHHPTMGIVMPDQFIPLSEQLGLIGPITQQVVDQALSWYASTPAVQRLSISINISAKTLGDLEFTDWLDKMCREAEIPNDVVVLEITETATMVDQLSALDMFTRLRVKGFHVSIDDFGIGHSSLAMLARLPFSEIKVDKAFAMTAGTSEESKAIIRSTVSLGHSLNLIVVAEGVEDEETLNFLCDIGCDFAQGYYIARPLSGDQFLEWMVTSHRELTLAPNTQHLTPNT